MRAERHCLKCRTSRACGGGTIRALSAGSPEHGHGMAYVDRTGLAIWIQAITGGAPPRLVAFPDRPILQFAWSPDGKRLAISRALTISDIVLLRGPVMARARPGAARRVH